MIKKEFQAIIERYLARTATPAEIRLIDDFVSAREKDINLTAHVPRDLMWHSIETALHKELSQIEKPKRISRSYIIVSILVLLIIVISFLIS